MTDQVDKNSQGVKLTVQIAEKPDAISGGHIQARHSRTNNPQRMTPHAFLSLMQLLSIADRKKKRQRNLQAKLFDLI